jgi:hypothetical protein
MKVLNLRCSAHHTFEGWFGSEADFQNQLSRSLIECPLCADKGIQKMPSAPRLNFGAHQAPDSVAPTTHGQNKPTASTAVAPLKTGIFRDDQAAPGGLGAMSPAAQANFLNAMRQLVANTEDVGQQFADEARRMHYGEADARSIRGQASAREVVDLLEEGIEVMPLPMLPALKETLQ